MAVTVYETQTPEGWDGLGVLTTLDRATITQVVQQTVTATEGEAIAQSTASSGTTILDTASTTTPTTRSSNSANPSSFTTSLLSSTSSRSTPASATNPPSTTQISTGSIVGIVIGSIAALVLLATCLLFAFGFRIRRAKRPDLIEITETNEEQRPVIGTSGDHGGKAELEDAGYTRRLERLHDGAKPELDGSKPSRIGWRAFSIKSLKRKSRPGVAELDAGPVADGPHELPA